MPLQDESVQVALQMAAELTGGTSVGTRTNLGKIARRLGVHSIEPRDMAAEGYLGITPSGGVVIRYRPDRPRVRVRFTIAHELGHILLAMAQGKPLDDEVFRADGETSTEELAVNRIAAEILMPSRLVGQMLLDGAVGWPVISQLCREFDVSLSAGVRRILELEDVPALWMTLPIPRDSASRTLKWSLRVSRNPEVMFTRPIGEIASALSDGARRDEVTCVEGYASHSRVLFPVRSRLVKGIAGAAYWCVSWLPYVLARRE